MRPVDSQHAVDRGRDARVEVLGFELSLHALPDRSERVGAEPSGLYAGAVGHDDVAPVVLGDEDQHAVDVLLRERLVRGVFQRAAVQRRNGHDHDLLSGVRVEGREALLDLRDRAGRKHAGAVLNEALRQGRTGGGGQGDRG